MFIFNESVSSFNEYEFLYESIMHEMQLYKAMVESDTYELTNNAINEEARNKVDSIFKKWCKFIKEKLKKFRDTIYLAMKNHQFDKKYVEASKSLSPEQFKRFDELCLELGSYSQFVSTNMNKYVVQRDSDLDTEEIDEFINDVEEQSRQIRDSIVKNADVIKLCIVPLSKYRFEQQVDFLMKAVDRIDALQFSDTGCMLYRKKLINTVSNEFIRTVSPVINKYL